LVTQKRAVITVVVATATAGLAGLALAGFVLLASMPEPLAPDAHAFRRFGLVALTFGWVGAAAGAVVGLAIDMDHPATAAFAAVEVGVVGFVLASAVGVVVGAVAGGADYCARTRAA
jgi:hypothetical protein